MSETLYTVLIERGPESWGASVPDLPGCVAVAETENEVKQLISEAIDFHLQDMRERGEAIPQPNVTATLIPAHA